MTTTTATEHVEKRGDRAIGWLQAQLPKLVLSPSLAVVLVFVYGFILWTIVLSFSRSRMLPVYKFAGFDAYERLWSLPNWYVAIENLAIFGILYIGLCTVIGLFLAILLDQRIRIEGVLRPIYLYPMALSFIVTGTAWKWFLNPGLGLEKVVRGWGWTDFTFDWLVNPDMAIYTIVIAAIWQSSGFVMAMFLAGLRGIDNELIRAAQIDGASPFKLYWRIIIPQLRPAFLSAVIVLAHLGIKSYDLVIALTGGGPGNATELPATFMYSYTFTRNQMAVGGASAVIMLTTIVAIIVPYLYSELRGGGRGR
jgi:glucose/mannose transport system permease protein